MHVLITYSGTLVLKKIKATDWLNFEEIEDAEQTDKNFADMDQDKDAQENEVPAEVRETSMPTKAGDNKCAVCHEYFETFFHQDEEVCHSYLYLFKCKSFIKGMALS